MKFICKQELLTKALFIVSRAVSSRATNPLLKGIMIKTDSDGKRIILSASDLELSIQTSLEAEIEEEGEIVVFSKLFSDITRKMPQGNMTIQLKENLVVEISGENDEFTMRGFSTDEFPRIDQGGEGYSLSLPVSSFKRMIQRTVFSASKEESRGIITGVLIEIRKEQMIFVALDGFRIAIVRENFTSDEDKKMVVNAHAMNEINKILSENDEEEDVTITICENKVFLYIENTKIVSRLMEGDFVRYNDIIPKEHQIRVKIDRTGLIDGLDRASVIPQENNNAFIRFRMEDDQLILSAIGESGTSKSVVPVQKEGGDFEIGFNTRYLNDILKAIDDEEIYMDFNTSVSPCVIHPLEGNDYDYMILPVRLGNSY